eukprot:980102-Amphidinium_carterae.1
MELETGSVVVPATTAHPPFVWRQPPQPMDEHSVEVHTHSHQTLMQSVDVDVLVGHSHHNTMHPVAA